MHGATFPTTATSGFAIEFGKRLAGLYTFGKSMAVRSMG